MSNRVEITVPDIGEFTDIPVIEVLVAEGERVEAEQSLVTLESDKATMEVPSPVAGVIVELKVALDDTVSENDVVAVIEAEEPSSADEPATEEKTPAAPEPAKATAEERKPAPKQVSAPAPVGPGASVDAGPRQSPPVTTGIDTVMPGKVPYASPAIRAFGRELGVDLLRVSGTGRNQRILREDVTAFVKAVMSGSAAAPVSPGFEVAPMSKVDFSKFGETELQALSRINKISAKFLHRNWVTIPHVTHNDHADVTELEAFRQANKAKAAEQGYKLTPLVFLIKACVAALEAFPKFNSSLDADGENLVMKKYFHIGIAVDTPDGLVVPVLRDCDKKSGAELAIELVDASKRARDGKLTPKDLQGGCFSISSLGGIGGASFSPIINAPEVAILGVSRSKYEPVWDGSEFQPRLMMPLSLSYDHRVIDGAAAARFTRFLAEYLEQSEHLVL